MFLKILGGLVVIWLAFTVLGFVIKGLFWLGLIGVVLFLGTSAYTAIKSRRSPKRLKP